MKTLLPPFIVEDKKRLLVHGQKAYETTDKTPKMKTVNLFAALAMIVCVRFYCNFTLLLTKTRNIFEIS